MKNSAEDSAASGNDPLKPTNDLPVPAKPKIQIVDVTDRGPATAFAFIGGVRAPSTPDDDAKIE